MNIIKITKTEGIKSFIPVSDVMAGKNKVIFPNETSMIIEGEAFENFPVIQIGYRFYLILYTTSAPEFEDAA